MILSCDFRKDESYDFDLKIFKLESKISKNDSIFVALPATN